MRYICSLFLLSLLLIPSTFADNWDIDFLIEAGDSEWTLTAGVLPPASASYDPLYDKMIMESPLVQQTILWKSFEPITETPVWLKTDKQKDSHHYHQWILHANPLISIFKMISWDIDDLPEGEWYIGTESLSPWTKWKWNSMKDDSSFDFTAQQNIRIRHYSYPIEDASGPVIYLNNPSEGATNVPINTTIALTIVDSQSWVDDTTISITLDGRNTSPSIYPIEYGYKIFINPLVDLPSDSQIAVIVEAGNVADTMSFSIETLLFRTSDETAIYSLSGKVTLADSTDPSGAIVSLFQLDSLIQVDTIGSDSAYSFPDINSGMYTIMVTKEGYLNNGGFLYVFTDEQQANYTLQPDPLDKLDEPSSPSIKNLISIAPNPFTTCCELATPLNATVQVLDLLGNKITDLPAGKTTWRPGETLNDGIYFIQVTADEQKNIKKAIYVR